MVRLSDASGEKGVGLEKVHFLLTGRMTRVRLKLPSQLKSATFSAWIKLDSLKQDIAPILCSEPKSIGSTCWSINRTGQIVLRTRGARENIHYKSAVAFRSDKLSRWSHVVTTYNAKLGIISHYVNGRSFSREKLKEIVVLKFPKGNDRLFPSTTWC